MSHQTGIKGKFLKKNHFPGKNLLHFLFVANDSLKKYFAKSKEGKIRVLKVSIEEGKNHEIK